MVRPGRSTGYGYASSRRGVGDLDDRYGHSHPDGDLHQVGEAPMTEPLTDTRAHRSRHGTGRPGRGVRQRQVDLRAHPLRARPRCVSSDFCRGLVADDENDQSATADAFDVLNYIVGTRLRRGLLTVVDATNVQQARTGRADQAGQEPRRARGRHRDRRRRSGGPRAQQAASRPHLRRPRRAAPAARPEEVAQPPHQGRVPPGPRPARDRAGRFGRDRARAALERPHATSTGPSTSSATSTAAPRSCVPC